MRSPCPALILLIGLVAACGSTTPPPSATVPPASPSAIASQPSPSSPPTPAAPSPSGAEPLATPTRQPDDFAPGVVVEIVHEVNQVADPERPRDDAFQSPDPRYPVARVLERQRPGYEVYLLESRVVDGREWWRIADSAHVGCCAPFGWIPALRADGSPVFRIADVICPAPIGPLTSYDLYRIDGFDPPVCHGNRDVTLRGYLACLRWNIDAPYFLNGLRSWDETGYECKLDDRLTVYGEVVPSSSSGTSANEWRDVVDVTGHYFAEESDSCRWVTGNFMHMPVDGAPIDTAQFACRMRFYATSVARLP